MPVCHDKEEIAEFLRARINGVIREPFAALGWKNSDGKIQAGCIFERFNGFNAYFHGASDIKGMFPRAFLHAISYYAFCVMKAPRITVEVPKSNTQALSFDIAFGFRYEGTLKSAAYDGGDLIIMVLKPETCRYLPKPKGGSDE
jgi:RimJ/RimL family protein N-acetyltransferase